MEMLIWVSLPVACVGWQPLRSVLVLIQHPRVHGLTVFGHRPFRCQEDRSWRITFLFAKDSS